MDQGISSMSGGIKLELIMTLEASSWENIRPARILEFTFFLLFAFHGGAQIIVAKSAGVATVYGQNSSACTGKG